MNIEDLKIGELMKLAQLFNMETDKKETLNTFIGKKVIIRTYSAGVFFGILSEKAGEEVILKSARRMYHWKAQKGISLSACALYGIDDKSSKIVEPVESIWLKAIEIIPCSIVAIKSLEEAPHVKAG